ncbi:PTS sugar transporter subunit IIA [Breznakiella homolactica]|uniref:PTS sugar transporter subunit IIA n=1 Tax=Breznakiella homolactica TaxID=2798577 RepID=A0A7T8BDF9_9SPIR|nr:PTS sugar transporter subunit IIA [Breznakiella homolactica]QQO11223.1 PTS sugar transporter subunit IIA [Breznakiella homolactica]
MLLHEVYRPEFIKVGLEADDKDEAFEEMIDLFCQATRCNARDEILAAVQDREAKMSTGIKKGIAIPHGKTNAVDNVYGILGISKKGVDYDALDGEPVYLLFMMLAPAKDTEKHLRLLKRLAELLDNPQFYTDMLAQNDAQSAYGVIKKYEDILITLD